MGDTPCYGLYWEALPKWGTLFRLKVYQGFHKFENFAEYPSGANVMLTCQFQLVLVCISCLEEVLLLENSPKITIYSSMKYKKG